VLVDCVNPEIVQYLRMVIALCFIGLVLALAQFLLDFVGPTLKCLRPLYRNAFFSIFTGVYKTKEMVYDKIILSV